MTLLEDFLFDPACAERRVCERTPVFAALGAFLAAGLAIAFSDATFGRGFAFAGVLFAAVFALAARLVVGTLLTACIHLSAEALGGKGRAAPLFALMGFSDLGWTLLPPAALIARALGGGGWSWTLITAVVCFFVFFLRARSVRLHYGLSRARAWTAVGLPYLAAAGVLALGFSFALWGALHQLMGAFT